MKIKKTLIADTEIPNKNNRVFSKEVLESIKSQMDERIKNNTMNVQLDRDRNLLSTAGMVTNCEINHNFNNVNSSLDIEVELFTETEAGKIVKSLGSDNVSFGISGRGVTDSDGNIGDFELISVDVFRKYD